ncbi:MAG: F0F1 ATP synthase subunit A [Gemmatimonadetes bacterium]|nr:F0F1 ATP synthase subunit A [Gemmatimonadota bacterium]
MIGRLWPWLQAAEPQAEAAAAPAEGGGLTLGEMIMHHVTDSRELEIPFGGALRRIGLIDRTAIELPRFDPIQLGPVTLDLSPTKHVVFLFLAAILVAVVMIWTARKTHGKAAERAPKGVANLIEAFVIYLRDEVALRNIGHGGERYVPYVLTLFFFILFANLLGLLPWGATATGNIAVTATLAFLSLVLIEVSGFRTLGPRGYLRTIVFVPEGMPWYGKALMAAIMTPVELLGKVAKPFALAVRLFANMTAGHLVVLALVGLIFVAAPVASWILPVIAPVVMAVAIMVLELFVALLQAFIFAMLTSVFIGLIRHAH